MSSELNELYQDLILDHYKHPRCQGCLENPAAKSDVVNPLCGDQISLSISTEGEYIKDIRFSGKGCSISQASASMMAEACNGKKLEEVNDLINLFKGFMQGQRELQDLEISGGDLVALQGVRKFTARIKCALLAWEAMYKCLESIDKKDT